MEDFCDYFDKSFSQVGGNGNGSTTYPSRQSFPMYSHPRSTNYQTMGSLGGWTKYTGSFDYSKDLNQLCLPAGSMARRRRGGRDIVEKFSALSLDDEDDDDKGLDHNPIQEQFKTRIIDTRPQIHHNIFQTKVTTNQISTRSLARSMNFNDALLKPAVFHGQMPTDIGTKKNGRSKYVPILLWILGIVALIFLLTARDEGSLCRNNNAAGMLMVTVAANVSEWDGIWRASFTVRSDNNLVLYILLIGTIVGFLRQIFDK